MDRAHHREYYTFHFLDLETTASLSDLFRNSIPTPIARRLFCPHIDPAPDGRIGIHQGDFEPGDVAHRASLAEGGFQFHGRDGEACRCARCDAGGGFLRSVLAGFAPKWLDLKLEWPVFIFSPLAQLDGGQRVEIAVI